VLTRRPDTIPGHKSGRARNRVSAPTRRCEVRRAGTCHNPPGGRSITTAAACAWFELHPNLLYIKYKVAEPHQV
jgi:hypothetical protein